ncbi:MAG: hypothetical protein WCV62_01240 [Candidatus Peribacteraceae bacterium]|jgi:hypothetical protein
MKRKKAPASQRPFVERVRELEERLFAGKLREDEPGMMQEERKFWRFRPSHHAATGLLTQEDVALLSQPGKRLLSVGAMPAYLERLLPELGVPAENILVTDTDPDITDAAAPLPALAFDMHGTWPETGTFDRIIFPESLCIAIRDRLPKEENDDHHLDEREAELLTAILKQALMRLRPAGILRANGPMSHPNVMHAVAATLQEEGLAPVMDCKRFFLTVQRQDETQGTPA